METAPFQQSRAGANPQPHPLSLQTPQGRKRKTPKAATSGGARVETGSPSFPSDGCNSGPDEFNEDHMKNVMSPAATKMLRDHHERLLARSVARGLIPKGLFHVSETTGAITDESSRGNPAPGTTSSQPASKRVKVDQLRAYDWWTSPTTIEALRKLEPPSIWKDTIEMAEKLAQGVDPATLNPNAVFSREYPNFLEARLVFNILNNIFGDDERWSEGLSANWIKGKCGTGTLDLKTVKERLAKFATTTEHRELIHMMLRSTAWGDCTITRSMFDRLWDECCYDIPDILIKWLRRGSLEGRGGIRAILKPLEPGHYDELNWEDLGFGGIQ